MTELYGRDDAEHGIMDAYIDDFDPRRFDDGLERWTRRHPGMEDTFLKLTAAMLAVDRRTRDAEEAHDDEGVPDELRPTAAEADAVIVGFLRACRVETFEGHRFRLPSDTVSEAWKARHPMLKRQITFWADSLVFAFEYGDPLEDGLITHLDLLAALERFERSMAGDASVVNRMDLIAGTPCRPEGRRTDAPSRSDILEAFAKACPSPSVDQIEDWQREHPEHRAGIAASGYRRLETFIEATHRDLATRRADDADPAELDAALMAFGMGCRAFQEEDASVSLLPRIHHVAAFVADHQSYAAPVRDFALFLLDRDRQGASARYQGEDDAEVFEGQKADRRALAAFHDASPPGIGPTWRQIKTFATRHPHLALTFQDIAERERFMIAYCRNEVGEEPEPPEPDPATIARRRREEERSSTIRVRLGRCPALTAEDVGAAPPPRWRVRQLLNAHRREAASPARSPRPRAEG